MLDRLLDCGGHLPILAMTLSWLTPGNWAGLRRVRQGFRHFLHERQLLGLSASVRVPNGSLQEVVSAILREEQRGCEGSQLRWAMAAQARPAEISLCEIAFVGLLRGLEVDQGHVTTGVTPLMLAAEEGHLQLCRLLLAHKANPNSLSIGGSTALSLALDTSSGRGQHSRPDVALLLLQRTTTDLADAFSSAVRLALQDLQYLPVVASFVRDCGLSANTEVLGPDSRCGTMLSVALEEAVQKLEAPLAHRPQTVQLLLNLRADPQRQGPYSAWYGGKPVNGLLEFAAANRCDPVTMKLLGAED